MNAPESWQSLLTTPTPGQHIAQLYSARQFLARAVGQFIGDGLRQGDAVIVIATPSHWRAILHRLEASDLDVARFHRGGQLVVRDAEDTLAGFMMNGALDRDRFRAVIGGALDAIRAAGFVRVRAFGEMVDILRRTDLDATIRLEELWNEVLVERGIALLCGYSLDAFDPEIYRGVLQQVSRVHSHLIPIEDYGRLERAVDRAYLEVFGAGRDTDALRRAFVQHYVKPSAMPAAAAAILALREFVPHSADAVLESARRYYDFNNMGGSGRPPSPPTSAPPA
jgi:hypothetical protein